METIELNEEDHPQEDSSEFTQDPDEIAANAARGLAPVPPPDFPPRFYHVAIAMLLQLLGVWAALLGYTLSRAEDASSLYTQAQCATCLDRALNDTSVSYEFRLCGERYYGSIQDEHSNLRAPLILSKPEGSSNAALLGLGLVCVAFLVIWGKVCRSTVRASNNSTLVNMEFQFRKAYALWSSIVIAMMAAFWANSVWRAKDSDGCYIATVNGPLFFFLTILQLLGIGLFMVVYVGDGVLFVLVRSHASYLAALQNAEARAEENQDIAEAGDDDVEVGGTGAGADALRAAGPPPTTCVSVRHVQASFLALAGVSTIGVASFFLEALAIVASGGSVAPIVISLLGIIDVLAISTALFGKALFCCIEEEVDAWGYEVLLQQDQDSGTALDHVSNDSNED